MRGESWVGYMNEVKRWWSGEIEWEQVAHIRIGRGGVGKTGLSACLS